MLFVSSHSVVRGCCCGGWAWDEVTSGLGKFLLKSNLVTVCSTRRYRKYSSKVTFPLPFDTSCGSSEGGIQDIVRNMLCHPQGLLAGLSFRSFEGKGNRALPVYAEGREEERKGHRGSLAMGRGHLGKGKTWLALLVDTIFSSKQFYCWCCWWCPRNTGSQY